MNFQHIELAPVHNRVRLLKLRREHKKNALCMDMRDELEKALEQITSDDAVHAVVLAGDDGFGGE